MLQIIPRLLAGRRLIAMALAASLLTGFGTAEVAAQIRQIMIVHTDLGGLLGERSRNVARIKAAGQRVELRGQCNSACTLYLGLETVCVSADARLGFHGPSWYGTPLPPDEFEQWSQMLASAYKPPLRDWYLAIARYRIGEPLVLTGQQLIRLGYPECERLRLGEADRTPITPLRVKQSLGVFREDH